MKTRIDKATVGRVSIRVVGKKISRYHHGGGEDMPPCWLWSDGNYILWADGSPMQLN